MPEITLDLSHLEVYEAGAMLVATLAYPNKSETDESRQRLHKTLCALFLRAKAATDRDWAMTPQQLKPIYALRSDKDINRDLRTFERRLRDRMVAARMAIAFLQKAETGEEPLLPEGVRRLSINELANLVLDDAKQTEPENVESRIWRPSLPVIHLAAAIAVLMQDMKSAGREPFNVAHIVMTLPVIRRVVETARSYEALVERSPALQNAAKGLMRFRLVE